MKNWPKILITLFILFILITQALASVGLVTWRAWPFMVYGMYCSHSREGDSVPTYSITGIREDDKEVPIVAADFDFGEWHFLKGPIDALADGRQEEIKSYVEIYERKNNVKLKAIMLHDTPTIVMRDFYFQEPIRMLRRVDL